MKVETIKTVLVPLSIAMIDVQDSDCLNVIKFSEIKKAVLDQFNQKSVDTVLKCLLIYTI
jgi:hypothetical protein